MRQSIYCKNPINKDVLDMDRRDDQRLPDVLVPGAGTACGTSGLGGSWQKASDGSEDYTTVSQLAVREPGTSRNDLPHAPSIPRQDDSAGSTAKAAPQAKRVVRTRVYVAGPLAGGNTLRNIKRAVDAGSALLRRGYAPFIPHLNSFWDIVSMEDFSNEEWLAWDFEWLGACDVLVRLPGESPGSDREVELAKKLGIPVYHSLDTLCAAEASTRLVNA